MNNSFDRFHPVWWLLVSLSLSVSGLQFICGYCDWDCHAAGRCLAATSRRIPGAGGYSNLSGLTGPADWLRSALSAIIGRSNRNHYGFATRLLSEFTRLDDKCSQSADLALGTATSAGIAGYVPFASVR